MNEMPPFLASFTKPSSYPGIDWNYIDSCDPVMINETKDYNSLKKFMTSFMNSKLASSDRAVLSHPTSIKLVQLLQITIKYLLDSQEELSATIEQLEDDKEVYKQKVRLLTKKQNQSCALLRDAYHDYEKCPICAKRFKSMKYVDQHMKTKHNEHLLAWKSLRINSPIDPSKQIKELQDEIVFLKDLMNKQNAQFLKTVQNFNARLEAQKRDFERRRKVVPTMEYIDSNRQFHDENFDMKLPDPNKFGKEDGVTYPRVIPEKDQYNKFKQDVLYLENRDLKDDDSEDYLGIEDAEGWLEDKTKKATSRMHLGLGANYITPKQVEGILRYDNPTYQHFYNSAKTQLEHDFPMPDKTAPKKKTRKNNFFNTGITSSSASEKNKRKVTPFEVSSSASEKNKRKVTPVDNSSSAPPVKKPTNTISNSSSYNSNSAVQIEEEETDDGSVGEVKADLNSDDSGTF